MSGALKFKAYNIQLGTCLHPYDPRSWTRTSAFLGGEGATWDVIEVVTPVARVCGAFVCVVVVVVACT